MLLYYFNSGDGGVYICRQRHNGVVIFLSRMSWFYAPRFILTSSRLTKNKYVSSLILRLFIKVIHGFQGRRGVWSFSHSVNETICAFTSAKLIDSIGVDIEYITQKPRKAIIAYLESKIYNNVNKTHAEPHLMAIIIVSCMESAFKALSFLIKENFSLDIFELLLITENCCRLRIKIDESAYFTVNVNYFLKDRRVVSVCCVRNIDLAFVDERSG